MKTLSLLVLSLPFIKTSLLDIALVSVTIFIEICYIVVRICSTISPLGYLVTNIPLQRNKSTVRHMKIFITYNESAPFRKRGIQIKRSIGFKFVKHGLVWHKEFSFKKPRRFEQPNILTCFFS